MFPTDFLQLRSVCVWIFPSGILHHQYLKRRGVDGNCTFARTVNFTVSNDFADEFDQADSVPPLLEQNRGLCTEPLGWHHFEG